ncbi:MAG TPA: YggS family pyridoxal phosphate-dependent enzyme [Salinivirga sp.]|uniref:YggS family pyridoxal phosphate-dependent enzyme n=1 Tax=Salinivirga sp. TaxID=1970192 RepID=UPI002B47A14A|nr:YggS family pyridoxal phosphate-dependent enzyme [Salinivirga sp.]HKK58735.1 YggS family pyridoxal phosphate-dependent enzyme [Salinivirga sp.]
MSIKENLQKVKEETSPNITLVAVSKTKPVSDIIEAYDAGQIDFGENKAQELQKKQPELPDDIRWHMIGHMQRNKVKYIAPFVHMIHAVDSYKLAKEIQKQAAKNDRVIDCLLQFHIAEESTKFGFSKDEFFEVMKESNLLELKNIRFRGVMGMATFTEDQDQIRREFKHLKQIFDQIKDQIGPGFDQISMGMSQDYKIAIEEGATIIRVGSSIFGARNY